MSNRARVSITGNLIRDPEIKTVGERKLCAFTVAVNTRQKKEDGTYDSNFYDCSYWGPGADYAIARLQKGTNVTVDGKLAQAEYDTKDQKGNNVHRYRLRVEVDQLDINLRGKEAAPVATAKKEEEDELPI